MAGCIYYLACPGIIQMGKLRLREAREECHLLGWYPSLSQTQISGFQMRFLPPSSKVTNKQPVATSTPQMCFSWPESVLIWMSCQRLKIRRFHIKTQISGFSWTIGRSAKWGLHSCVVTIEDPSNDHSLWAEHVFSLPQSPPLPLVSPDTGAECRLPSESLPSWSSYGGMKRKVKYSLKLCLYQK